MIDPKNNRKNIILSNADSKCAAICLNLSGLKGQNIQIFTFYYLIPFKVTQRAGASGFGCWSNYVFTVYLEKRTQAWCCINQYSLLTQYKQQTATEETLP